MYGSVTQKILLFSALSSALAWWRPAPGTTREIVLRKTLDDIGTLPVKNQGYRSICCFSAGPCEDWRADADSFPAEAIGNPLDDWEGEAWLDTRNEDARDIMRARIDAAAEKGCDAIDSDNLDVYEHDAGGFDLTIDDAVDYVQFLSEYAHSKDLSFGLKNGGLMVEQVLDLVGFEVNEQCQDFNCPDCDEPHSECRSE
ncbi:hypothetical protein AC579_2369 [Pseudocercospora musae]|uniref:alpha-galactosidase n=1 Tax=Pseudocercospora musae TaxID=113226 RepID=A0A139IGT0_9PEZI|nr:hypothetical protein AC579_2369 [Pseudocercospora musae]